MSNKKKTKTKFTLLAGFPDGSFGLDAKGRAYRIVSPGGLQPGAMAVKVKRGLNGDYDGTCVGCLQPTDTGLAIGGPAEAQIGFCC